MKRVTILSILAFIFLVLILPAESEEISGNVRITADTQEYSEETNSVISAGNVRIEYQEIIMTADRVNADMDSQRITADGNVTVKQGDRVIQGDHADYSLVTKKGLVTHARTLVGTIIGTGEKIVSSATQVELQNATITTCDLPHPHYHLAARRVLLIPGKQIRAEGVSFYLKNHCILSLPPLKKKIGAKSSGIVMPQIGYSKASGIFAHSDYDVNLGYQTSGVLDLRLGPKQFIQGGLKLDQIYGKDFLFQTTIKEEVHGLKRTDIMVDRLPFFGYSLNPLSLGPNKIITLGGILGAGYFKEHPTHIRGWRGSGEGKIQAKPISIARNTELRLQAGLLQAYYDDGNSFGYIKPQAELALEPAQGFRGGLTYIEYQTHGKTPFLFDTPDVKRELQPKLGWNKPGWLLQSVWRYDLEQHNFFDTELTYLRRLHCMQPSIVYSIKRSEIRFDLTIPGI